MDDFTITVGDWTFDVFLCEDGNLGFTVYAKGKTDTCNCTDIIVDKDDIDRVLVA